MDTTDSKITFNGQGICDHCIDFETDVKAKWFPNEEGTSRLKKVVLDIKNDGKNRDFDCILGMSGGLDSSYMLHLAVKELGLRPLVFHVDSGWNSEQAVKNIQLMIEKLGLDLYTEVINWEEMKDLQLAFIKSGVPHIDIPQDMAYMATLFNFANKHNIKYILNGGNVSTECVRNPKEWIYYGTDMLHMKDIIKKFGTLEMQTFQFLPILKHKFYLRYVRGLKMIRPLDNMIYNKEFATDVLMSEYGWKPFVQKHFESRFTKFYEGYWLPQRFGFDTRKVQLSSLILTKQICRAEAINLLKTPSFNKETIEEEFNYVATKLGISSEKLKEYFNLPKKFYWDYKNQQRLFDIGAKILKMLGVEKSIKR
jgi:N-acetyl sugar amidotransferase